MACPNDTDGDGDCGRLGCPYCGGGPAARARHLARLRRATMAIDPAEPRNATADALLQLYRGHVRRSMTFVIMDEYAEFPPMTPERAAELIEEERRKDKTIAAEEERQAVRDHFWGVVNKGPKQ